jgi:hypothetical protein
MTEAGILSSRQRQDFNISSLWKADTKAVKTLTLYVDYANQPHQLQPVRDALAMACSALGPDTQYL